MPCSCGSLPVNIDAWALQVTAGSTSCNGRDHCAWAKACSRSASGRSRDVRPTVLRMTSGCMSKPRGEVLRTPGVRSTSPQGLPVHFQFFATASASPNTRNTLPPRILWIASREWPRLSSSCVMYG